MIDEETPVIVALLIWIADPSVPVLNEVAVTTPDALKLVRATSASSESSTPLLAAVEVRFVPPVIAKPSVRRSISSDPLSPVTVNPLPTAVVVADVTRPLESTVSTGIADALPNVPAETPLLARVAEIVALAEPSKDAEPVASPEIAKVLAVSRALAVAALPEVSWLPDWFTPGKLCLQNHRRKHHQCF